ncbi:hypothetical protein ACIPW4_27240 [Pseudomonas sp. NPDC089996]|uniref:hypothetical protein n=1 Tax=Pseudomonas sp. NPDC089996 TaxID=3364474 RepID=UPI0038304B35
MSDIRDALEALRLVHDKYQIAGRYVTSKDSVARWPSELPRSAEVDVLFSEYEPVGVKIETGFTPLKLFDIASLKKGQFGYRWINVAEGAVLNNEWPDQDLVIMDDNGGGKPVIAVTDVEKTPVYACYDVVPPFQIAESLADFILALSKMIDIVYGDFNIFDLSDDDGIDDAFLLKLQNAVSPILGDENTGRFVDYFYG